MRAQLGLVSSTPSYAQSGSAPQDSHLTGRVKIIRTGVNLLLFVSGGVRNDHGHAAPRSCHVSNRAGSRPTRSGCLHWIVG
jgi:hypothetical protein